MKSYSSRFLLPYSKSYVLQAIQSALMDTTNESLRMKIAEIAGELAGAVLDPSEWPTLHQLTGELCNVRINRPCLCMYYALNEYF